VVGSIVCAFVYKRQQSIGPRILLWLNDLAMSLAYQQQFRQNMINLSRGSQSACYGLVVGNFSSYFATLISLAAGFSRAPFGRQSKQRINRDLITTLGGYLLQWSEGAYCRRRV